MLTRHVLINRNILYLSKCINDSRYSHKLARQFTTKLKTSKPIHQISFNSVRNATTISGGKKNIAIIAGLCIVGGSAIAYTVFHRKSSVVDDDDDTFVEIPYVHERLDEDLALIAEHSPIPYLLIGAGCASFTAYKAIRARDPVAKILVIGDEPFYPYMRPPLSKEMWYDDKADPKALTFSQWNGKPRSVFYENDNYFFSVREMLENKNGGISVIRGKKVVKIDPVTQTVYLDKGEPITYKKCLIATGSKPKNLPVFEEVDNSIMKHVTLFRSVRDFQKLSKIHKKSKSIVVIGGGFLGSELACGLANKGKSSGVEVTQIFPETGVLAKVLPEYLSSWTAQKLTSEGVKIIPNIEVKSVSKEGNDVLLHLSNNDTIQANHVIVAVGADANTDLAKTSSLEVDPNIGGFLVNTELEARRNLYVAGDAACFYDIQLGRRRVEHHDHAIISGRLAGGNMADEAKPYWHQSMFWSDLGPNIGFEALGIVDSALPTVGVFTKPVNASNNSVNEKPSEQNNEKSVDPKSNNLDSKTNDHNFDKGIVFYLRDNVIVGMIFWNIFGKMQMAREIINESKSSEDIAEITKLFDIHST